MYLTSLRYENFWKRVSVHVHYERYARHATTGEKL